MFYKETTYKEAEAGRFPADWDVVRLGEVCGQRKEIVVPSGNGVRFVGLEHVESGETRLSRHSFDSEVRSSKFEFHTGDILYGKLRPYLDKAVVADFDGICSTDFIVLRVNEQKLVTKFLLYLLHSRRLTSYAISKTTGTNHPRTSWNALSNFPFGLPPIAEQRGVAQVLSTVDEAIQKTNEVIAKTERLKNGLMQELLSKGIGHKEFKDSKVGSIPKEWVTEELGDLLDDIRYGTSVRAEADKDGVPTLGIPNVLGGEIDESNLRFAALTESEKRELALKDGDLLLVRTNANPDYIGRCALFSQRQGIWAFASYLIRIRPKAKRILPHFLVKYLQSEVARRRFLSIARTSAGNYNINTRGIQSIVVPVPSVKEQEEIAMILVEVDNALQLERKEKATLDKTRRGLVDLLLTGKVRVKVN